MRVHTKHSATRTAGMKPGIAVPSMATLYVPPAQGDTLDVMISHKTTAMLLAFCHPDLITQNPEIARVIWDEMTENRKLAQKIGRESRRDRVCQSVSISVVAVSLNKKTREK